MHVKRSALRGEIWSVQIPTDPPDKGRREVVVVSSDARNRHERATTVLVVPLFSTNIDKESSTHTLLQPGETGLAELCVALSENLTVIRKEALVEPRYGLRQLSHFKICEIADKVKIAMGCLA